MINKLAWVLTIIIVIAGLYALLGLSGAGNCSDVVAGACVP